MNLLSNESWSVGSFNIFMHYFNLAFPKKNKNINGNNKYKGKRWQDEHTMKLSEETKSLHWLWKRTNSEEIKIKYKQKMKEYKTQLKKNKKDHQ